MFQLILVLISIALVSVTTITGINYLNPAAQQAQTIARRLEADFHDLKKGYLAYVAANEAKPQTMASLTPHYAFKPVAVGDTAWSYGAGGAGGQGRYFCLSGTFAPAPVGAILRLKKVFSPQAYFINSACGATANATPAADATTFTGAVTLWVAPYL